ncbi:hypothetical protein [Amycolatopsis minnesotensis]|uniref:Uncharacterized protein n=1 Tax=Amycolatopsis minnesotensis TaxID=337894 RepID=A0ABN2SFT7_9PSEU
MRLAGRQRLDAELLALAAQLPDPVPALVVQQAPDAPFTVCGERVRVGRADRAAREIRYSLDPVVHCGDGPTPDGVLSYEGLLDGADPIENRCSSVAPTSSSRCSSQWR